MSEENKTVELEDKELKQVTGGASDNASTFKITIRDIDGRDSCYTVSPDITIYDLKLLYTGYEGHVIYVRLLYEGTVLDNSRTIASYNIPNEAQIHAIWNRP